jgi:hypothetical protein
MRVASRGKAEVRGKDGRQLEGVMRTPAEESDTWTLGDFLG